jgi:uncharacterized protein DUF6985
VKVRWDGENWRTTVALPKWRAHLPAKLLRRVPVVFNPEGSEEDIEPTAAQLAAVRIVVDKQAALLAAVGKALRRYYDEKRPMMVKVAAELPQYFPRFDTQMPARPSAEVFGRLHRLTTIYVQPTAAGKRAHVGFAFDAAWEVEHGVGVLTHGVRVRAVGDGDTALLEWVAEDDERKLARQSRRRRR